MVNNLDEMLCKMVKLKNSEPVAPIKEPDEAHPGMFGGLQDEVFGKKVELKDSEPVAPTIDKPIGMTTWMFGEMFNEVFDVMYGEMIDEAANNNHALTK